MSEIQVQKVSLRGIASAVPAGKRSFEDLESKFGFEDAKKISDSTGFVDRFVSDILCASDLCLASAKKLLHDLEWDAQSVDVLIFVSQTPDYILPATSAVLHGRLGLKKSCIAFDINLGCSGYVYGLSVIASLMSQHNKRALLLAGDTISRIVSHQDRSTYPIFGDAGTATALEYDPTALEMLFELGTDGNGGDSLIVPAGGFRTPNTLETAQIKHAEGENKRSQADLYMKGTDVFSFTIREIPALIKTILERKGSSKEDVDYYIFHQANQFMLEHLGKKMKLPTEKFVRCFDYGNTSVASIPLAMTSKISSELRQNKLKLCLSGFGVGFSWGAAFIETDHLVMPELIYLEDPHLEDPQTESLPESQMEVQQEPQ
jgi:3-oxoacyl-[acyl-carrier-protein] synthase III